MDDSTLTGCEHIFDRHLLSSWIEKETVSKITTPPIIVIE